MTHVYHIDNISNEFMIMLVFKMIASKINQIYYLFHLVYICNKGV